MALVTAYLARTAQRSAGRATVSATRTVFERLSAFVRVVREALSEAHEMRLALTRKYPFMDV